MKAAVKELVAVSIVLNLFMANASITSAGLKPTYSREVISERLQSTFGTTSTIAWWENSDAHPRLVCFRVSDLSSILWGRDSFLRYSQEAIHGYSQAIGVPSPSLGEAVFDVSSNNHSAHFSQLVQGFPVEKAGIAVTAGNTGPPFEVCIRDSLALVDDFNLAAILQEAEAVTAAIAKYKVSYEGELPDWRKNCPDNRPYSQWEEDYRTHTKDLRKPGLVVVGVSDPYGDVGHFLSYKIDLFTYEFYIDAHSGAFVRAECKVMN